MALGSVKCEAAKYDKSEYLSQQILTNSVLTSSLVVRLSADVQEGSPKPSGICVRVWGSVEERLRSVLFHLDRLSCKTVNRVSRGGGVGVGMHQTGATSGSRLARPQDWRAAFNQQLNPPPAVLYKKHQSPVLHASALPGCRLADLWV